MPDCLFCKIIRKDIPSKIEFEDGETLIIQDVNPQAPVHVLVIPKKHIESISAMQGEDYVLAGKLIDRARQFAQERGWADYRLVFNNGTQAGQSVFHVHLHLLSGRRMTWPPG
jgi:histidine triad (HIT) family protein